MSVEIGALTWVSASFIKNILAMLFSSHLLLTYSRNVAGGCVWEHTWHYAVVSCCVKVIKLAVAGTAAAKMLTSGAKRPSARRPPIYHWSSAAAAAIVVASYCNSVRLPAVLLLLLLPPLMVTSSWRQSAVTSSVLSHDTIKLEKPPGYRLSPPEVAGTKIIANGAHLTAN